MGEDGLHTTVAGGSEEQRLCGQDNIMLVVPLKAEAEIKRCQWGPVGVQFSACLCVLESEREI